VRRPFSRSKGAGPRVTVGADERIWGRHYTGPSPWIFGLIILIVIGILSVLAYTKQLPFTSPSYEVGAVFENATTVRATSPVRIAGVKVGEVTSVERDGDAARVNFSVDDSGQPIHTDAEVSIRPRLFLEGNFFLDLKPGSPSAPVLDDGGTIPITQTATAVQLDEILTALQAPERKGLQRLLEGYGTGLTYVPTAEDDADQDPIVKGETAAKSLNDAFKYGGPAGRGTTIVNTALLGENEHDLSGFIKNFGVTFGKLASREDDLSDLITNFNTFTGALAAESANLSLTIEELAPTLEEAQPALADLSNALPAVRALAIESLPGFEELPTTIADANPWLDQTDALLQKSELGGLAKLVKKASPPLAQVSATTKGFFDQQTALARCTSEVFIPAGDQVINDDFSTGQPNYREFFYSTVQLAGESQGFDGNGPYVRFESGGGGTMVQGPNPGGIPGTGGVFPEGNSLNFANVQEAPVGQQPYLPASPPPYRPDVACASNPVPNVNGPGAAVGAPDLVPVSTP
jgi:phospholipid/cholesterol/gamma-HCH transport system substrate-binding protein